MIVAVRVRGLIGREAATEATLRRLHLYKKNCSNILQDNPTIRGMLAKVKDYITWGEIDDETATRLKKTSDKPFFRLNSPRKGFGRKGIKKSFLVGGALGNRKEKINDLINRML